MSAPTPPNQCFRETHFGRLDTCTTVLGVQPLQPVDFLHLRHKTRIAYIPGKAGMSRFGFVVRFPDIKYPERRGFNALSFAAGFPHIKVRGSHFGSLDTCPPLRVPSLRVLVPKLSVFLQQAIAKRLQGGLWRVASRNLSRVSSFNKNQQIKRAET